MRGKIACRTSFLKGTLLGLLVLMLGGLLQSSWGQSSFPVRTRWVSPTNQKPLSFREWKARWEARPHPVGGEVVYRSPGLVTTHRDSFTFGQDYLYYKAFVMHQNMTLCEDLPPTASFIVMLNGDDSRILTEEAPRWSFGDPNISGLGWFGVELGNFNNPAVAVHDSFTFVFTCYNEQIGYEQGTLTDSVQAIPLPPAFPQTLYLQGGNIPLPPKNIRLSRQNGAIRLCWKQEPGYSYLIYRRNLNDTLALHFPRGQFEKIAENVVDSVYWDTSIDTTQIYGYILFSKRLGSGEVSGHSPEVREEVQLPEVRAILVQPTLYSGIASRVQELVTDWESEGAQVVVYSMQFASPTALRDTLRHIPGLTGALLIGDFPVPWYQVCEDSGQHYQEFPCDLFFMDLDGIWQDNYHYVTNVGMVPGGDGIYDTHTANFPRQSEKPEIVVGRITPTPGMGPAEEVINFYLEKLHQYRHDLGGIRQNFRALAFPDDDWHEWGDMLAYNYINQVYPEVISISNQNQTTASNYEARLDDHFSLIHVWVHSWPQGHSFKINNGTAWDPFYNYQILPANTNANFFQLFACGNCRYVEDLNCGAIYTLQTVAGINAIGTTHSGGMLHYDYFYQQLAQGMAFGEAFLRTFQFVGKHGFSSDMKGWYYGLTFLGDPFVVPEAPGATPIVLKEPLHLSPDFRLVNYPNPFNNGTQIEFTVSGTGKIVLQIYDLLGREVRSLHFTGYSPDKIRWYWDGTDAHGNPVAGGVYWCVLKSRGKVQAAQKMVYLK